MFECECGERISHQRGDDRLTCRDCGRDYDPVFNTLSAVHVVCPRCSTTITDFGRERAPVGDHWRVDDVRCPHCPYEFVTW
jgi:ribosomal protein S27E